MIIHYVEAIIAIILRDLRKNPNIPIISTYGPLLENQDQVGEGGHLYKIARRP